MARPKWTRYIAEGWNLLAIWRSLRGQRMHGRPISLNLLITDRCNSKCVTCDIWQNGASGPDPLDINDYRNMAKAFSRLGTQRVAISGGEPLLRKDLEDIIQVFHENGFFVQLTTHGLHTDANRLESLWNAGLDTLTFSLDHHTAQGYQSIRGVDWFDRVIKHIRLAASTKPSDRRVETNTVITTSNIECILDVLNLTVDLGVDGANLSPVVESGESNLLRAPKVGLAPKKEALKNLEADLLKFKRQTGKLLASKGFIQGITTYLKKPYPIAFPCYAGYASIDVYANGDVRSCGSTPVMGNIKSMPIEDLWTSSKFHEQRLKMVRGECPGCYVSCKIEPSLLIDPKHTLSTAINRFTP